tara:strand:+ start:714 stop:929 length:216 start_codon:yes stop_codon:yes gene_type:complete
VKFLKESKTTGGRDVPIKTIIMKDTLSNDIFGRKYKDLADDEKDHIDENAQGFQDAFNKFCKEFQRNTTKR